MEFFFLIIFWILGKTPINGPHLQQNPASWDKHNQLIFNGGFFFF